MNKNNRRSLIIRLQPTEGTPLAEVVDWLNSLPSKDRKEKIDEACLMFLLPLARAEIKQDLDETESCYWDTHNRIIHYMYVMRQILGIRSIQPVTTFAPLVPSNNTQAIHPEIEIETEEELEEELDDGLDFSLMLGTSM